MDILDYFEKTEMEDKRIKEILKKVNKCTGAENNGLRDVLIWRDAQKELLDKISEFEPIYVGEEEQKYKCSCCGNEFIILMFNEKTGVWKCDKCLYRKTFI